MLALPLFMFRIDTRHIYPSPTTDNFTVITHWLDACTNFHSYFLLFCPIGNSSFGSVIGRHLKLHLVSWHNADKMKSHFA